MLARTAMVGLIAAILGGAVYAIFGAPWYVVESSVSGSHPRTFFEHDAEVVAVGVIGLVVVGYYLARLLLVGMLVIIGRPSSGGASAVAWYTPRGAHVHGAFALAAAVAMYLDPPVQQGFFFQLDASRSWGGLLFVGVVALSHVAIFLLARVRVLAYTQAWVDDDGRPVPRPRHRWLRVKPQERPLIKSPLTSGSNVGGDPFRVSAPVGLDAKLVKPTKAIEPPRIEDDDAPPPKLLV